MSFTTNYLEISGAAVVDLKNYLLAHEEDIYYGVNDFGDLAHVFQVIMERPPTAAPSEGEK
jgi:hypothetical protein